MQTRLIYYWRQLIGSFWFIPLAIVFMAIGFAFALVYIDTISGYKPAGIYRYLLSGGPAAARSILSTIAGAMIGVAGTVFSITLVALTMASSQFGPRLLQNFMYDRINQIVLGSYIATFIFSIIVLRTVKSIEESEFVPNLSILFAIVLAIANIILLVVYVHHTAMQIQADQVVAKINKSMHENISHLIEREKRMDRTMLSEKEIKLRIVRYTIEEKVLTETNGYLQAIDMKGLVKIAAHNDLLIQLFFRPGDFLISKEELLRVYSTEKCTDEIIKALHDCFISGSRRTATQDTDFGIHQMVEIASRALSPGVNDPYTAINCIDNLTAIICYITQIQLPAPHILDNEKKLRILTQPITFKKLMDTAFNQIRRYGYSTPAVLIRLMESFARIDTFAHTQKQLEVVEQHAKTLLEAAEKNMEEKADMEDLLSKYNKFKQQD